MTLIGFSCFLSARACKGKSSLCESTLERTIWLDSTLHLSVVIAAARQKQRQLNCLWCGLCGFWLWNQTDKKSRKKSICEWLSRAISCNTSYSEHVFKWEHDVQIHVQLLPVTLKQSLISSVLSERVCVETQPWTFLIHLQQTFTHFHHACTNLHNVQHLHTDRVKKIS